jgi:hypothetical protein
MHPFTPLETCGWIVENLPLEFEETVCSEADVDVPDILFAVFGFFFVFWDLWFSIL